jgi:hypothetical protein
MAELFRSARPLRRVGKIALSLVVGMLLVGCTGRGGGWLPSVPVVFPGQASFGFSFSCERSSNSTSTNPPTGRLRIQLQYSEKGTNALGSPFSIHGEADKLDPVLESAVCIGENPPPMPPGSNVLIFLGSYRFTSSSTDEFFGCPTTTSGTDRPPCRFEVKVIDNDSDRGPSKGDEFTITLSSSTVVPDELDFEASELPDDSVIYIRGGILEGGNIEVD